MESIYKKFVCSIIITLIFSSACIAATTWEYVVKTYPLMGNDNVLTQQMNGLGKQGWELVNCTEGDAHITCVFKRPIQSQ